MGSGRYHNTLGPCRPGPIFLFYSMHRFLIIFVIRGRKKKEKRKEKKTVPPGTLGLRIWLSGRSGGWRCFSRCSNQFS